MPTAKQWKKDSSVRFSSRDPILKSIDDQLAAYHQMDNGNDRIYAKTQIFFTIDYWLKLANRKHPNMDQGRKPAVETLYKYVVASLCQIYNVAVNILPRELEATFGRVLGHHGSSIDSRPGVAHYLTRAQAQRFRLRFKDGLAYQFPWRQGRLKNGKLRKANTEDVGWTYSPSLYQQMLQQGRRLDDMFEPGMCGFAMSMSRDIYVNHHRGGFGHDNFFHSSYLAGDAVQCSGSMLIRKGQILCIKNDSGHYRPTLDHIVNVLECLKMHNVDLSKIMVKSFMPGQSDLLEVSATTVLATRGDFQRLTRGSQQFREHWNARLMHAN
jgi:hypothetical protein